MKSSPIAILITLAGAAIAKPHITIKSLPEPTALAESQSSVLIDSGGLARRQACDILFRCTAGQWSTFCSSYCGARGMSGQPLICLPGESGCCCSDGH
ncbi:hypothetical protein EJ08DRAFT_172552 [Tothia fuscella]|uniref:Invertebrate defensins family profile domain-containing protein n=1 Tax=Tothia fuscella TaxID=1048955 RepID=A0A9P4NT31_9PEZI|nr:hypothetical protein EJ08DRAFT_172552 [Tothia fuscella]